jgi:hypothetical protein
MSTPSKIDVYMSAAKEFSSAQAEVKRLGEKLSQLGGELLKNPVQLIFNGESYSADLIHSQRTVSVAHEEWPTSDKVAKAVRRYYDADELLKRAIGSLSQQEREILKIR